MKTDNEAFEAWWVSKMRPICAPGDKRVAKDAWQAACAFKEREMLLSRVQLPEKKSITMWAEDDYSFEEGFNHCLDQIKLVPLELATLVNEALPSDIEISREYANKGMVRDFIIESISKRLVGV